MNKYLVTTFVAVMHFFCSFAGEKFQPIDLERANLHSLHDTGKILVNEGSPCTMPLKNDEATKINAKLEWLLTLIVQKTGGSGTNGVSVYGCKEIDDIMAILYQGKQYLLFNPLGINVSRLNIDTKNNSRPIIDDSSWIVATMIAHEYSHHSLGHLSNPKTGSTDHEMELEADEAAGFIIYLLGGTLKQAQLAFLNISETGTYTHPGKKDRLDAVEKGYFKAKSMYKLKK